jgi:amino acid permease
MGGRDARCPRAQAFSLLAIATSYIGFVLGLSDFLADYLKARGAPRLPDAPAVLVRM